MSANPLVDLLHRWHEDAETLRRRGAPVQADALEACADEVEDALRRAGELRVSIAEAARITGFSEKHLRRLVRDGTLPDDRPEGSQGPIRLPVRSLPRKASRESEPTDPVVRHLVRLGGQG